MDLIKLITEKVEQLEKSGKLNEIVEKHALECIDDIVRDSFMWSGEAKKAIGKALENKLQLNLEEVKIPQYGKLVSEIVNDQLNGTMIESLKTDIKSSVDSVTEILEKKEWKLSEIISEFIDSLDKSYDGEMDDLYGECSLFVECDERCAHIYFDKEEGKERYECENKLFLSKGKLCSVTVDEKTMHPFSMEVYGSFERFMFKLYCNNVSIIIDEDKCELIYTREDYD
jgi:hypothetical protein